MGGRLRKNDESCLTECPVLLDQVISCAQTMAWYCHPLCQESLFIHRHRPDSLSRAMAQSLVTTLSKVWSFLQK